MKGYRIFGGCPSMPAGRVSIVKYAGNCKTTTLEPVYAREKLVDKNAVRFYKRWKTACFCVRI
ncbi:hypothetical protein [Lacrimispora defluvii]|uniref:Uncharacterized protein n=1 Tax=Lacrimispora defluvii TaxID=2719233 RepID=A0ABX1VLD0_9FIRM|nr:hypothetical protein [Lacrimispora defluvii]NNJ29159.1 hypothetical protein [Lacrimispora defluvii]